MGEREKSKKVKGKSKKAEGSKLGKEKRQKKLELLQSNYVIG